VLTSSGRRPSVRRRPPVGKPAYGRPACNSSWRTSASYLDRPHPRQHRGAGRVWRRGRGVRQRGRRRGRRPDLDPRGRDPDRRRGPALPRHPAGHLRGRRPGGGALPRPGRRGDRAGGRERGGPVRLLQHHQPAAGHGARRPAGPGRPGPGCHRQPPGRLRRRRRPGRQPRPERGRPARPAGGDQLDQQHQRHRRPRERPAGRPRSAPGRSTPLSPSSRRPPPARPRACAGSRSPTSRPTTT
jgi:hypothetical protein